MPKVVIVQVIYNNRKFIEPVFGAIFNQTHKNFEVVAVISGNDDNGKELLEQKFPQVKIIDPSYNIGFAKGHNLVFSKFSGDFFQLVNPDFVMEPDYIEKMLEAFTDEKVGAATGKLYQAPADLICKGFPDLKSYILNHKLIDTTGVVISKSGRARDRGQHEEDKGQYNKYTSIQAVSAAGAMYRASALDYVKARRVGESESRNGDVVSRENFEFFDEDFHSYWEDVDLAWRMSNAGWQCKFVPSAVGYHGRGAGSSKNGYVDVTGFIKHHKALPKRIRELNYQNHIFMYIKNSPWFYPQFFIREFFMFGYILLFEISTLKVLPRMIRLLPKMWKKRILINNSLHSRP